MLFSTVYRYFADGIRETLCFLQKRRKGKLKDPIEEVKKYIEQNLGSEISLEEVAELLGLHPNYFSVMFKQMTGETFVQYRITSYNVCYTKLLRTAAASKYTPTVPPSPLKDAGKISGEKVATTLYT